MAVENQVFRFLRDDRKWPVTLIERSARESVILYQPIRTRASDPQCLFMIDAAPSDRSGHEIAIQIRIDTLLRVPSESRAKAMDILNQHHADVWAGTFFIDKQNDVLGQWTINLPEKPLAPEYVADAITRLQGSWTKLDAKFKHAKISLTGRGDS